MGRRSSKCEAANLKAPRILVINVGTGARKWINFFLNSASRRLAEEDAGDEITLAGTFDVDAEGRGLIIDIADDDNDTCAGAGDSQSLLDIL